MPTAARMREMNAEVDSIGRSVAAKASSQYKFIARTRSGGVGKVLYAAMDDVPTIKKPDAAGYPINDLSQQKVYELNSDRWGNTLRITEEEIEDDKYDIFGPRIQKQQIRVINFPEEQTFKLLMNGHTAAYLGRDITWVDGKNFFATDHPINPSKPDLGNYSNLKTLALDATNWSLVYTALATMMDTEGEPLRIWPNRLIVPPDLENQANQILWASTLTTAGVNVLSNDALAARNRPRVEIVVSHDLHAEPTAWYCAYAEGDMTPMVFQNTKPLVLIPRLMPTDDNVYNFDEYQWRAKGRAQFGWGDPRLIIRSKP